MAHRLRAALLAAPLLALASCQIVSGLSSVDLDGTGSTGISDGGGGGDTVCTDKTIVIGTKCNELFLDEEVVHRGSQCFTNSSGVRCHTACAKPGAVDLFCALNAKLLCKEASNGKCLDCTASCACAGAKADCFSACDETCKKACNGSCDQYCGGACVEACFKHPNSCAEACDAACGPSDLTSCYPMQFDECLAAAVNQCEEQCMLETGAFFCDGTWMSALGVAKGCDSYLSSIGVELP